MQCVCISLEFCVYVCVCACDMCTKMFHFLSFSVDPFDQLLELPVSVDKKKFNENIQLFASEKGYAENHSPFKEEMAKVPGEFYTAQ